MKAKDIVILGDSYSTFSGYIPDGYAAYYPYPNDGGDEQVGVTSVRDTWWWQLADELSLNIVQNNSWSGSTVSYTGRHGDCSATSSFIFRAKQLIENGILESGKVDTVLIFGATNDSWIDVPLGENKSTDITHEDLFSIRPAIFYLVELLTKSLPYANVVYILNTELNPQINEAAELACRHYGARLIKLHDIDKIQGHPTARGMAQIKDQVMAELLSL